MKPRPAPRKKVQKPIIIRTFKLRRIQDHTGVSGTGDVAVGVIFPSGKVVWEWVTEVSSMEIYDSFEQGMKIHGHDGKSKAVPLELGEQQNV